MPLLFSLVFNDLSIWWVIPCLILGFAYAWLFYEKTTIEQKSIKQILFFVRFIAVSLLALLLLSPLIKSTQNRLQKPLIFIAQDASASIKFNQTKGFDTTAYRQNMKKLATELGSDYEVREMSFSGDVKEGFDYAQIGKETDISSVFKEALGHNTSQNIGALIIATDGVYNKGANPLTQLSSVQFPVYTIALGDTIPKRDLILLPPTYNQLVYLGNNHQVEVLVKAFDAKGADAVLKMTSNDGQTQQQHLFFNKQEEVKTVKFTLAAKQKGLQKISFNLQPLANEVSVQNNRQTLYVEVLDGREKILLAANAPHPDLTALKQSIERNQNYQVTVVFADQLPVKTDDYGLVVLHNLPSVKHAIPAFLNQIKLKNKWFIVGTQTSTSAFNQAQDLLEISPSSSDQSFLADLNPDFYAFTLSKETKLYLQSVAPLTAPFANYQLKSSAKVLLKQQVGAVKTNDPLFAFNSTQDKTAVLVGEGIWRWRMENYQKHQNFEAFDELMNSTIQYLNAVDDKRKFRVKSSKNRYSDNEEVSLFAELYNDAYELVNEPEVKLELTSKEGKKFSFVFSRDGKSYKLNAGVLPAGEYHFLAKTQLGTQTHTMSGEFLVEALNIELMGSQANHQLLYNVSKTTGGVMVPAEQLLSVADAIKKNEKVKTIRYQEKSYEPLINLKWIFVWIVLLLSFEWFLRKRNGAI